MRFALHTYGYSVVALVELNIISKFPSIFWNTACLIVDSAGVDYQEEEDSDFNDSEEKKFTETQEDSEEEDDEEDEVEEVVKVKTKTKKKSKPMDYGKVSIAIGKIQDRGIKVSPPDINKSNYTFTPDVEHNKIIFGIKGISKINSDLVKTIMANRPYESVDNFLSKVKVSKPQMVNLIKSGAFDSIEKKERKEIMFNYIDKISDKKKRLTLQNIQMLINFGLIPEELDFQRRLFNFNKYLKNFKKGTDYVLDKDAFDFYSDNYDVSDLEYENNIPLLNQKYWEKIYNKEMDPMRAHLKSHPELLDTMNEVIVKNNWDKYCKGNLSKWEMDSISFYNGEHELAHIDEERYMIENFFDHPEEPEVVAIKSFKNITYPVYNLYRIAGTVLNRDKNKNIVTILTPYGVVPIKVYKNQFTKYDKQISVKLPSGKKQVVEKSWFTRGNKIMVVGFRRGNNFVPKIYKNGPFSEYFKLITKVNEDGSVIFKDEREVV